jgi:glycosyltransferase involved in cell wall biosynthesis
MDTRKGIDLLIAAFATGALGCDCRLLLAGLLSPDVQSLLIGPMAELVHQERIIVINRYLDDSELHAAMSALDVVCTPYPRHIGSASIVIRAAAAGRPVVASDFGWLGMVVPRFNLGWLCDDSDPRSLGSTIGFALQRSSEFRSTEAARRFVSFHSVENFQTAWTVRLRERLGLPVMPIEPSWDAVLAAS